AGTPVSELIEAGTVRNDLEPSGISPDRSTPVVSELTSAEPASRSGTRFLPLYLGAAGLILGFLLWWILAAAVGNAGLLPGPAGVVRAMGELLTDPELRPHFAATLLRAVGWW